MYVYGVGEVGWGGVGWGGVGWGGVGGMLAFLRPRPLSYVVNMLKYLGRRS